MSAMRIPAITLLICLGLTAAAAAQGTPNSKAAGGGSKAQLSEIRSLVHELERTSSKLDVLIADYRSLMDKRPRAQGSSPDAKAAQKKQFKRWDSAVERLLRSIQKTHAAIVETTKRLKPTNDKKLPTSLGKELADARNTADAAQAAGKQVLSKRKPKKRSPKRPKKADPGPAPELDLDAPLF